MANITIPDDDLVLLDANETKIKKIKVDKFMPGKGIKTLKAVGLAFKEYTGYLVLKLLEIPVLRDVIGIANGTLVSLEADKITEAVLKIFYPTMDSDAFNRLNPIVSYFGKANLDELKVKLNPEDYKIVTSPIWDVHPQNLSIINDAKNGEGVAGWFGIVVKAVAEFIKNNPDIIIAGGAVLITGLGVLANKVAKIIKIKRMEKKINKEGTKYQKATLKLLRDLLENSSFRKTRYYSKFCKLTKASIYIIGTAGSLSDSFLVELNELLESITNKLKNSQSVDLKQEYERLGNMLESIAINANDVIDEHNRHLK